MKKELITSLNLMANKISNHAPEILTVVGLITGVATVVTAAKSTLNVEEIVDSAKAEIEDIKEQSANVETNEEGKLQKETSAKITKVYFNTGVKLVKNYAPSIILGVTSTSCILAAHGMMRKRTASLIAAYNTLDNAFKTYRQRVIDKYGENVEKTLYFGTTEEKVDVMEYDETGAPLKTTKKKVTTLKDGDITGYSRFFESTNVNWKKIPDANILFIRSVQNYLNDLLKLRGHLFLNEAYDLLGFERTTEGQVVGWTKENGFVQLDILDLYTLMEPDSVDTYENSYLIDFNVQGVIIDKI